MTSISTNFTAVGTSTSQLTLQPTVPPQTATYAITGTFVATLVLERTVNGGQTWEQVTSTTTTTSGTLRDHGTYRWKCTAFTSGTAVAAIADQNDLMVSPPTRNYAGETVQAVT